ncbi:alpha-L-rhamnosidase [Kribbella solani]|uniref:alpha-L-rhamnosidase n=1 Tax=Kribbella solani TaxID=236067 RepID=A0A841DKZ7_9ACTN|nr:alpha-L-rhamnosidase [Kribbella solani]MBB5977350.1 alpha-L-rhamnosidase [Kribbella solani]
MNAPNRPYALRVDHLTTPLGIGPETPRVSWKLPPGAAAQHAYRIVANGWDSGRVESEQSTWLPVAMVPASGLAVTWKVKTWTDLGESEWSAPSTWEVGLLTADWRAEWIGPVEVVGLPARQRPAFQLGGAVSITGEVVRARLYATAHGVYEAFVNGRRVGDHELTPGWTAYNSRLQVQTFDVTDLLVPGVNMLGALLSDGWWRGQNSVARRVDDYGTSTAFLAQLVVTFADGSQVVTGTDEGWRSIPSHVLGADLIAGEVHDLRRRVSWSGWRDWQPVVPQHHGYDRLCPSPAPPVRRIEELRPVSVRELSSGRWLVDVGQNINGWVRLRGLGSTGTEITLTYGEWLDRDGDVTQDHVAWPASTEVDRSVPFQVDRVVAAGNDDDVFEPRHSTKGFQYVRVEGYEGTLTADDVTAVVVHTDLERRGSFACSDPRLEAIHRIAVWSFRDNACDIPTDCPTRERAGWTGDWQIYVETAAFLYDVGGFSVKWLRDLAAEQRPDGRVTNLVPESHPGDARAPTYWPDLEGSAGWGDAAVHVPWQIYRATGDERVLADQWQSMRAWVDYAAATAAGERHPARVERRAEPAAHERLVWDTGWHFGEWLEPGQDVPAAIKAAFSADHGPVATAYLHRSAHQLAQAARILGRDLDAARYARLAADVATAWQREFLTGDGQVTPGTQATYVRALAFGLIPAPLRAAAAGRLAELVRAGGYRVGTGFLATAQLLPVLAEHGYVDVAYELLLQHREPSWLVMVDRGATTIWEEWDGIRADGTPHASLNHYSKGAVISFLHQYVAGLQLLEPGWRRFRVAPHPGSGLNWAEAQHESPYGTIATHWERQGNTLKLKVQVPPGTTADIPHPNAATQILTSGTHTLTYTPPRPNAE